MRGAIPPPAEASFDLLNLLGLTYHQIAARYGHLFGESDSAFQVEGSQGNFDGWWAGGHGRLRFYDVELEIIPGDNFIVNPGTTDPRTVPIRYAFSNHPLFHVGGITINSSFNDIVASFGQPADYNYWTAGDWDGSSFEFEGKTYWWSVGISYSRYAATDGSGHRGGGVHLGAIAAR